MTQKKLAEKVMVSPSSITRLESGQTMVSVFTIIKIAEVLNTSISFLLSGDEDDLNKSDILEIAKKLDRCTAEQREVLLQSFGNILDAFFPCLTKISAHFFDSVNIIFPLVFYYKSETTLWEITSSN